jgi:GntR family transcriptional regulator
MIDSEWNDSQPIYRQLHDRIVTMILEGVLEEGDPFRSVRTVAADYRVNPLTVLSIANSSTTHGSVHEF